MSIHQASLFLLVSAALVANTVLSTPQPQQPAPPSVENSNSANPLHITTRLVQVNAIVNDKHGNPLTGQHKKTSPSLTTASPRKSAFFSAETNLPSAALRASLARDTYTNRSEELINIPASVTVILLDALNTEAADQTLVRKQVIRVLQEIQPQEYVALYWLGNGLHTLHDFTADSSALRQILAAHESNSSRELDNSELADPSLNTPNPSTPAGQAAERQAFRLAFDQRVANQSTRNRVHSTVAALIAIANHLGSRKGRKNLVWVSSSFPISLGYDRFDLNWVNDTGEDFATDVQRAARALTDADIAVYPVDARGLLGSNITANQRDSDEHIGDPTDTDTHLPVRGAPETFDTMRLLAERTGGKAFYGTNDLTGAIRHAMNDSRLTYTLGYYPASVKWDGSFHEIKVRVAIPGAEVRARSGYFAIPNQAPAPVKSDHALLSQLASSGLPATGIGLHVRVQTPRDPGDHTFTVEVHLDLREINMRQKNGRWIGSVQAIFFQLDGAGHVLQVDDRTFFPDFDARTYEQVLQAGISDSRQVRVSPNATQLCIVVRDPTSSNMGSIYVPIAKYSP